MIAKNIILILPVLAVVLSSCTTTPEHDQALKDSVQTPEYWSTQATQYTDTSKNWLESFEDPILLKLIDEGKKNNLNLQIAAGNMDKAWLLAEKSGSMLKPTADALNWLCISTNPL